MSKYIFDLRKVANYRVCIEADSFEEAEDFADDWMDDHMSDDKGIETFAAVLVPEPVPEGTIDEYLVAYPDKKLLYRLVIDFEDTGKTVFYKPTDLENVFTMVLSFSAVNTLTYVRDDSETDPCIERIHFIAKRT